MYFPYFRGRRFELLAIRRTLNIIRDNGQIIPIIEPFRRNIADLSRAVQIFRDNRLRFILITNPQGGQLNDNNGIQIIANRIINDHLDNYDGFYPAFIISATTTLPQIQQFLTTYANRDTVLIHYSEFRDTVGLLQALEQYNNVAYNIFIDSRTGTIYRNEFQDSNRVLIRDGFIIRRNADYPEEENFSDLNLTYNNDGYQGFGDFLIVGDTYVEAGGPAHAVAIHLTYQIPNGEIFVRHFVSDDTQGPQDTAGKFLQAVRKLNAFVNSGVYDFSFSNSCNELVGLFQRQHFPQLGPVKEYSMRHHLELLARIL